MYEIKKKLEKKTKKKILVNHTSQNSKKNIELPIGEVNGHFYLKIKMKKVRKKSEKKAKKNRAELLRPVFKVIMRPSCVMR